MILERLDRCALLEFASDCSIEIGMNANVQIFAPEKKTWHDDGINKCQKKVERRIHCLETKL